ncbi:hypothetical protein S7711_03376 [Stachybotrys chartarum IBT 7711]|uniref:Enoyl reductase (ER) domain-containing protein n=1 Tax=Stachybotrys chartarum (strain CBS 109288 / IBT 7711) TaxID=1280523 RepID=A0A084AXW3_STACB|nr:hypothetical protein S7711_03376 [Stachybotrys chartarum IBT 7711]KFA46808.1 hypothetical protein S40293_05598 [Stachybotrys chartarum IBT 40293]
MSHTVFRLPSQTGIQAIQVHVEPIPSPSPTEVLVRVRSVALNYRDIAICTGAYPLPVTPNVILGSDMAGEVVQVGAKVDDVAVGDKVTTPASFAFQYGLVTEKAHKSALGGGTDGVLAEYFVMPAYAVVKLPTTHLGWEHWAALIAAGGTAWNAFYDGPSLRLGQTVLVLGTGGVSLAALVLAKAAGATTIVTSSSDTKLSHVIEVYGADHAINYKTYPDWAAEVLRITNGRGADYVIEVGGSGTMGQSLQAVARGGVISVIGFMAQPEDGIMPDVAQLALIKGVVVRGVLSASKQQLEEAVHAVGTLGLEMPIDKTFGFSREEVIKAFEYVASGKHMGKVCITVG